ncbi:hypothetical protein ACD661_12355 [Legionella lytica]|uniref:Uncharacterized protein n=1 Tax=Legionella lytica TaxID=96232 RepID=A0ABW8DBZ1_9GAMM
MLLTYVKNSKLTLLINTFDEQALVPGSNPPRSNRDYLAALVQTMQQGEIDHPLFAHPNIEVYLAYLYLCRQYLDKELENAKDQPLIAGFLTKIRHQKQEAILSITKQDFLQQYMYLLARRSYDQIHALKLNEPEHKMLFDAYLQHIQYSYPNIDLDRIQTRLQVNPGLGNLFIAIEEGQATCKDELLKTLLEPSDDPTIRSPMALVTHEGKAHYLIPPLHLVEWIARECNPMHQIQIEPCFGIISPQTLYQEFHLQNKRLINLPSQFVRKNLETAHELSCTPFSISAHDSHYHFIALALLSTNEFRFIMDFVIPKLSSAVTDFPSMKEAIEELNDLPSDSSTNNSALSPDYTLTFLHQRLIEDPLLFYFGLIKLIPEFKARANEINQQFGINIQQLTQLFSVYEPYHSRFERCHPYHALGVYHALDELKTKDLLNKFIANLLFRHSAQASHLAAIVISFQNYPNLYLDESLLNLLAKGLSNARDDREELLIRSIARRFVSAAELGTQLNLPLMSLIISQKKNISLTNLIILNQQAESLVCNSNIPLLIELANCPLITTPLIQQGLSKKYSIAELRQQQKHILEQWESAIHDPFAPKAPPFQAMRNNCTQNLTILSLFLNAAEQKPLLQSTIENLYRMLSEEPEIAGANGEKLHDYIEAHQQSLSSDFLLTIAYLLHLAHLPLSKNSLELIFKEQREWSLRSTANYRLIYELTVIIKALRLIQPSTMKREIQLSPQFLERLLAMPYEQLHNINRVCKKLTENEIDTLFVKTNIHPLVLCIYQEVPLTPQQQALITTSSHRDKFNKLYKKYPQVFGPLLGLAEEGAKLEEHAAKSFSPKA